ncbi:MAG: tRNA (N6-isopentenyl adenosine(37)-C2)-methylthiotransferase MiaB [bacterium]|nr:tRNA (N6-isopentenyl adenosine(37)-C2)-methylthiotransferase MiaB [bacterium]
MKRVCLFTYGCQMNKYDSEVISSILDREGYSFTSSPREADIILLNTCSVRAHAEQRVFSKIGSLRKIRLKNPHLILGICGCMAKHLGDKLLRKFPYLDLVVGPNDLDQLPRILREKKRPVISINTPNRSEFCTSLLREDKIKAYVPINFGCSNYCSYCVVPYVRGELKSRDKEEIIEEIRRLAKQGYKEITLLGQNVTQYGRDLRNGINLSNLLEEIEAIDGLKRIRFLTPHPKDVTDELISAMSRLSKVCEHIHLPAQAGSNKILRKMNRGYTVEDYKQIVERMRERIPHLSITTDLIVGFPGEDEHDFEETLKLVEDIRFSASFTFKFSKRPGTKAANLKPEIPEDVKKDRLRILNDVQRGITLDLNKRLIGTRQEVLAECINPKNERQLIGKTGQGKVVIFSGDSGLIGEIVHVKVKDARLWSLLGELS